MKTLIRFLLVPCLAVALPVWSQNIGTLSLQNAPATNDWFVAVDVSDTSLTPQGTTKRFDVEAITRLAETYLRNLTTTGTVTAVTGVVVGDYTGLPYLTLNGNGGTGAAIGFRADDDTHGWNLVFELDVLGNSMIFHPVEHTGVRALTLETNGWISVNKFSAPASALDVGGTITGTGFNNTGNSTFGNAAADTITGNATGNWIARQTFQQTSGIQNDHGNQSTAVDVNVSTNAHQITLTGDAVATITGTAPAAPARTFVEIEFVQDATGGRTPTISPAPNNGQPAVDETANAVTMVYLRTSDGGTSWYAFSSYDSGGGGGPSTGVRSEMIPTGWMYQVPGKSGPAGEVTKYEGETVLRVREFSNDATRWLGFSWQRPVDLADGNGGAANIQIKWRWAGVNFSGSETGNCRFGLAGVGRDNGDGLDATLGTESFSSLSSVSVTAGEVMFGSWSEITVIDATAGLWNFQMRYDHTVSDPIAMSLAWIEFAYEVTPATYSSL